MAIEAKAGDWVHAKAEVIKIIDGLLVLDFHPTRIKRLDGGSLENICVVPLVENDCIVHVEPPPIKVGDMVSHGSIRWHVLAVHGDYLWISCVRNEGVEFASVHRSEVTNL